MTDWPILQQLRHWDRIADSRKRRCAYCAQHLKPLVERVDKHDELSMVRALAFVKKHRHIWVVWFGGFQGWPVDEPVFCDVTCAASAGLAALKAGVEFHVDKRGMGEIRGRSRVKEAWLIWIRETDLKEIEGDGPDEVFHGSADPA